MTRALKREATVLFTLCSSVSISLCFSPSFLTLSLSLCLPADSNISVPTHAVALCHHIRRGQCVDEANSKVSRPLWMLVRGHFRYSQDTARVACILVYLHSAIATYSHTPCYGNQVRNPQHPPLSLGK